ncbi:MAG: hypothetical protein R3342_04295 [Lutibacter sp.]|uniref:hypothetical protein n=1 Tax=Lutibacter sp. TaxID=1925666 RepID=UPI00299DA880|nr:hypothetical protein [Lutibacter sp.]MDX1828748.1 hypothetical protein [Lutibacter sp.]
MAYKKLKPQNYSKENIESAMREIWKNEYCIKENPIMTFDNIQVSFYEDMFDHCFYESANNKMRDKSILSLNRLEKMLWIKDTLQDETAILKLGWHRDKKVYLNNRRVNFVKGNYVVVISVNKQKTKARFITAYEILEAENIEKINNSPDWE